MKGRRDTRVLRFRAPIFYKWRSFGWEVVAVDGHDFNQLLAALSKTPKVQGNPTLVMAYTTKGKGVSFIENVAHWHHGVPTAEQLETALNELSTQILKVRIWEKGIF